MYLDPHFFLDDWPETILEQVMDPAALYDLRVYLERTANCYANWDKVREVCLSIACKRLGVTKLDKWVERMAWFIAVHAYVEARPELVAKVTMLCDEEDMEECAAIMAACQEDCYHRLRKDHLHTLALIEEMMDNVCLFGGIGHRQLDRRRRAQARE